MTLWCNGSCAGLEMPWLRVRISAGKALKERQCTPKEQARYANVRGSVHWKGVYRVGDRDLGVQNFLNWFLKLTNQKRPKAKCLVRHLD